MEKSTWAKIVWLGAILAIPVAVWAVQKPEAHRATSAERQPRVMTVDQPMSVDISDRQIEGAKPAEAISVGASADAPKPQAMRIGTEKITLKGAAAPPAESALTKSDILAPKEQNLAAALAPVPGPQTTTR
jgi:hypothetical protein